MSSRCKNPFLGPIGFAMAIEIPFFSGSQGRNTPPTTGVFITQFADAPLWFKSSTISNQKNLPKSFRPIPSSRSKYSVPAYRFKTHLILAIFLAYITGITNPHPSLPLSLPPWVVAVVSVHPSPPAPRRSPTPTTTSLLTLTTAAACCPPGP